MVTLYILKCKNEKYYVGKSNQIDTRICNHFLKNGCAWTKIHHPIRILEIIKNADNLDEDKYTKIYMKKYGIDNVRGGSYTQIDLPDYKIKALKDELCTIQDTCFRCKRQGHFIQDCFAKKDIYGKQIEDVEEDVWEDIDELDEEIEYSSDEELDEENENVFSFLMKLKYEKRCFKCGRRGHSFKSCYAKTYDYELNNNEINMLSSLDDKSIEHLKNI